MLACSLHHTGRCGPALARLWVTKAVESYAFAIRVCRQCRRPLCLDACPVPGAMAQTAEGVVHIRAERCNGCAVCVEACPFAAIAPSEELGLCLKCDLCHDRVEGPLCVELCPTGALAWEGR